MTAVPLRGLGSESFQVICVLVVVLCLASNRLPLKALYVLVCTSVLCLPFWLYSFAFSLHIEVGICRIFKVSPFLFSFLLFLFLLIISSPSSSRPNH